MKDGIGIVGATLNHAFFFALFGSTLLVFFYLWRKGELDMDESPKNQMMQDEETYE